MENGIIENLVVRYMKANPERALVIVENVFPGKHLHTNPPKGKKKVQDTIQDTSSLPSYSYVYPSTKVPLGQLIDACLKNTKKIGE